MVQAAMLLASKKTVKSIANDEEEADNDYEKEESVIYETMFSDVRRRMDKIIVL